VGPYWGTNSLKYFGLSGKVFKGAALTKVVGATTVASET